VKVAPSRENRYLIELRRFHNGWTPDEVLTYLPPRVSEDKRYSFGQWPLLRSSYQPEKRKRSSVVVSIGSLPRLDRRSVDGQFGSIPEADMRLTYLPECDM
jgi:hypothetical protein